MNRPELLTAEYGDADERFCTECPSPADIRLDCGRELCTACAHEVFVIRGCEEFRARKIGTVELLTLTVAEVDVESEAAQMLEVA